MKKDILYLGSQSTSRQNLLKVVGIDFKTLEHKSDECGIDIKHGFESYVLSISEEKMDHLVLPQGDKLCSIFVLTADTLVQTTREKEVFGKPKDLQDAKRMLRVLRDQPIEVVTGCCLEKKLFKNGTWKTEERKSWTTGARVEFCVDEESLDIYFEKLPQALRASTAGVIEDFGQNFLKSVNGSYTAVLGLPIFELRQNLKMIGFRL